VGSRQGVVAFVSDDSFLRRIDRKRYVSDGAISADAFGPRTSETTLSFTHRDAPLKHEGALGKYQHNNRLPSGDLPGVCFLTLHDLTSALEPPLPPRLEVDQSDPIYGHLHCVTDCPRDHVHREKMAKLATSNGLLLAFIKKHG
jgi:hypothetical protein